MFIFTIGKDRNINKVLCIPVSFFSLLLIGMIIWLWILFVMADSEFFTATNVERFNQTNSTQLLLNRTQLLLSNLAKNLSLSSFNITFLENSTDVYVTTTIRWQRKPAHDGSTLNYLFYVSTALVGIILTICLLVFIRSIVYVLFNYLVWNNLSHKTKLKLLDFLRREPLPNAMNNLYQCIVEKVDRLSIEKNARDHLQEPLNRAFTRAGLSDAVECMLVGSVAEKFSLPYHPGFSEFRHGNISDYDFMMSLRMESASFNTINNECQYRVVSNDPELC